MSTCPQRLGHRLQRHARCLAACSMAMVFFLLWPWPRQKDRNGFDPRFFVTSRPSLDANRPVWSFCFATATRFNFVDCFARPVKDRYEFSPTSIAPTHFVLWFYPLRWAYVESSSLILTAYHDLAKWAISAVWRRSCNFISCWLQYWFSRSKLLKAACNLSILQ